MSYARFSDKCNFYAFIGRPTGELELSYDEDTALGEREMFLTFEKAKKLRSILTRYIKDYKRRYQ